VGHGPPLNLLGPINGNREGGLRGLSPPEVQSRGLSPPGPQHFTVTKYIQ